MSAQEGKEDLEEVPDKELEQLLDQEKPDELEPRPFRAFPKDLAEVDGLPTAAQQAVFWRLIAHLQDENVVYPLGSRWIKVPYGCVLITERGLARAARVDRFVVRRALKLLQDQGTIRVALVGSRKCEGIQKLHLATKGPWRRSRHAAALCRHQNAPVGKLVAFRCEIYFLRPWKLFPRKERQKLGI